MRANHLKINSAPGQQAQPRTPSRLQFLAAVTAVGAVCLTAWHVAPARAGDETEILPQPIVGISIPVLSRPAKAPKWNAAELRAKYPFESLSDRLAYEGARTPGKKVNADAAAVRIDTARQSLDKQEWSIEAQRQFNLRTRALAELHSVQVNEFISREGFGRGRMPLPTPDYLELPEAPPLQFASVSSEALRQEGVRALSIPEAFKDRGDAIDRLPSLSMLEQLHTGSRWDFLRMSGWGLVKSKEQVAGFQGHAFSYLPRLVEPRMSKDDERPAEPDPQHPWHVTRLELVSLLKHDTPKVYVSERLPRMSELGKAKMRDLAAFESEALKRLQTGEELAAAATLNRIRMLGAVRASKQCLECHEAERGDLLGAFSYELRRDPPVKPVRKPAA